MFGDLRISADACKGKGSGAVRTPPIALSGSLLSERLKGSTADKSPVCERGLKDDLGKRFGESGVFEWRGRVLGGLTVRPFPGLVGV